MQRYFVSKENNNFILKDSDLHHIKNVMRLKSGDNIICVYENHSYLCSINYTKENYSITVLDNLSKDVELDKKVILYQALIKNDNFDLVVQKATEIGASIIVPTIFKRSVIKIDNNKKDSKIERYNKIVKEASEQSHRQKLPTIAQYINVKDIKLDKNTLGLMAYENNQDSYSFKNSLYELDGYQNIAVVIGPEGGFEQDELDYLLSVGFKSISLGKRILRSETAAIYALSVISYYLEGK